jgi:hypothetical protein
MIGKDLLGRDIRYPMLGSGILGGRNIIPTARNVPFVVIHE